MKEKRPLKITSVPNQNIPEKDLRQFQTEIEVWKQLLNSRMEENVLLKNAISDILKNNFNQNSLEEIEGFQTQFIKEDDLIHLLRSDISDIENVLYSKISENGKIEKSFDTKIENLRRDLTNSTISFRMLKSAFHDFQHTISAK